MIFLSPGIGPEAGACAPSRPHFASGLTHIYWHQDQAQHRLDQARVTQCAEFRGFDGLREYVLDDLRYPRFQSNKLETYGWSPTLYAPMINIARGHQEEDCWRCEEAEADDLSCWIADLDNKSEDRPHASESGIAAGLAVLCGQQIEHFTYTTYSSVPEHRKFRVTAETSRNVTRAEQRDIYILFNERLFDGQGDGSIYDRGDHIYGPPCNTETTVTHGVPLPVDDLLAMAEELRREQPDLWTPFVKKQERRVARAATPVELGAMQARMLDRSACPQFGGIDDPAVFNPDWRDEYPRTAVSGTHYHTMLSLLGRVWRKTGGKLSGGEMQRVFEEIDALDGFYMTHTYPAEKAGEMLRFVMSQPVLDDPRPDTDALERRMRRFKTKFSGGSV
jgi:hypothetical protein